MSSNGSNDIHSQTNKIEMNDSASTKKKMSKTIVYGLETLSQNKIFFHTTMADRFGRVGSGWTTDNMVGHHGKDRLYILPPRCAGILPALDPSLSMP